MSKFEENPFEDERVSQEWIQCVESEKDTARDQEIYPRLKNWTKENSPEIMVEIGSGQGICAEKCELEKGIYIGFEPSASLVKRAKELYRKDNIEFRIGNAYDLPIASESVDAAFAVNVWFHLENIELASSELSRILKAGGKFLIITPNPAALELWKSWYTDVSEEGKKFEGRIELLGNPLSKNILYQHSLRDIVDALEKNGLKVGNSETFSSVDGQDIFIEIRGEKI